MTQEEQIEVMIKYDGLSGPHSEPIPDYVNDHSVWARLEAELKNSDGRWGENPKTGGVIRKYNEVDIYSKAIIDSVVDFVVGSADGVIMTPKTVFEIINASCAVKMRAFIIAKGLWEGDIPLKNKIIKVG